MKVKFIKILRNRKISLKVKLNRLERYIQYRGDCFISSVIFKVLNIILGGSAMELSIYGLFFLYMDNVKDYNFNEISYCASLIGHCIMILMITCYLYGAYLKYHYWCVCGGLRYTDVVIIAKEDIFIEEGYVLYKPGECICYGELEKFNYSSLQGKIEIVSKDCLI